MKKLFYILMVIAMFVVVYSCEKEIFSTSTNQSSAERVLQTEARSMQGVIQHNDVIIEDVFEDDIARNIIFQSSLPDLSTAHVVLEDATIRGDIITLTLSYSGGCKHHEFDMVVTTFEESNTVRVSAGILHYKNDDPCDQWVTETRAFNLSPLKERYFDLYDIHCDEIIINIFDDSDPQTTISISYYFCLDNPVLPPGPPLPPVYHPLEDLKEL